jgi:hypothetical protein
MGRLGAESMVEQTREMGLSIDAALSWHLQSNHFPPVSTAFIPVCKAAIEAVQNETPELKLEMPNGVTRTAAFIVDGLHLDPFLPDGTDTLAVMKARVN